MQAPDPLSVPDRLLREAAWVRRLAGALVADPGGADDLAQETWRRALERPPRHHGNLRAWLARIARHVAVDLARGERARRERERADASLVDAAATDELAARAEAVRGLVARVLALPEPYRDVLLLRYFEGLTLEEVARRLALPASTARTRHERALARLRQELDREHGGRAVWLALFAPQAGEAARSSEASLARDGASARAWTPRLATPGRALALVAGGGLLWTGALASHRALGGDAEREPAGRSTVSRPSSAAHAAIAAPVLASRREAVSAPADTDLPLLVRVADEDGAALAGARVLLVRDGEIVIEASTDADGLAALGPPGDAGSVFACAPGRMPVRADLAAGAQRASLAFPPGAVVSGRLVAAGDLPEQLVLVSDRPLAAPGEVPDAVLLELDLGDVLPGRLATTVARDGSFRFAGLPGRWSGTLRTPDGHWLRAASLGEPVDALQRAGLWLSEPAQGLVLDAPRLPRLAGRLADAATGAAVGGATVGVRFRYEEWGSVDSYGESDGDGRFAIDLAPGAEGLLELWRRAGEPRLVELSVWVSRPRGARLARELGPDGLPPDGDVGTLPVELPPGLSPVRVRAVDDDARGIAGAVWAVDGEVIARSDAAGGATLAAIPSAARIEVGAPGFAVRRLERADLVDGAVVRLEPVNRLEVRLAGAPGACLEVAAERAPFVAGAWMPSSVGSAFGLARCVMAGVDPDRPGRTHFLPDAAGRVLLEDLRPGLPLRLGALRLGEEVAAAEVPGLTPREHRVVELELGEVPASLTGVVRDAGGAPLGGARVRLRDDFVTFRTSEDGAFRLRGSPVGPLTLVVEKDGFAARVIEGVPVGASLDVALEPGRVVDVTVVDPSGVPVDLDGVDVSAETRLRVVRTGRGRFRVLDAPPGGVLLVAGDECAPVRLVAEGPEARIELDPHGALSVDVSGAAPERTVASIELARSPDGPACLRREVVTDDLACRPVRFAAVPAGAWTVRIAVHGAELAPPHRVEVAPGAEARALLELRR